MRAWWFRLGVMFLVVLSGIRLYGQVTGQITGTVTDMSGAIVPGAHVVVRDANRGILRQLTTNSAGGYLASALPMGHYSLQVTAHGFKTYLANGIVLRAGQRARINVSLQVGAVTSTVNVSGNAIARVQLESATVSSVINGRQVKQLELNGRNFAQLIMLVPGVVNTGGTDEQHVGIYGSVGSYNINGGRSTENNWEIDGANVEDNGSNGTLNVYPSIDAISQVRVLTSNYGAQYARDSSGTVLVNLKSGTNQWHGDAYEFFRNKSLNARNFFAAQRSPYSKNDYGFTLGGPIIKNKTFIFWSEEWRKSTQPTEFNQQVPSLAERSGNFSDVCPAAGSLTTPANLSAFGNCPVMPGASPAAGTGTAAGQPGGYFPNNQVPVSADASALLPLISAPNTGSGANSFFVSSPSYATNWYETLFRVDQNFGQNWHLYYQFIHDSWNTTVAPTLWSWANFPSVATNFQGPGVAMVAHLTTILSPTLTNEFIAGYTADHIALKNNGPIMRPASFSMGGIFNNGFKGMLPGIALCCNPMASFGEDTGDEPWFNSNPTYTYRDQVNQIVGSQNFTYGAELDAAQKNEMAGGDLQGFAFFCACGWTNSSGQPGSTGNALADMFLGNMSSFNQVNVQPKYYDEYKTGDLFFQDDWHATPRLTFNMGLQVDLMGAYFDTKKLDYNFEPAAWSAAAAPTINSDGSLTGGNLYNGLVNCGVGGAPRSCNQNHLWNFAPRFGFAYDIFGNGTTSLRGGFGVFYDHTNSNDIIDALRNPPGQLSPTVNNISGYAAVAGASGANFPLGIGAIPTVGLWPMVNQWNLDVERQFHHGVVGEIAYVGSKGTHLMQQMDMNQIYPSGLAGTPYGSGGALAGQPLNCTDPSNPYLVSGSPAPSRGLLGTSSQWMVNEYIACGGNANLYVPYIGYGGIGMLTPGANSNYNALQATLHGTFGGLFTSVAYTWSHALDDSSSRYDTSFVNSYDLHAMYASSNFNQAQNLSMSWVYQLPFFHDNTWLGGWEWSGIATAFTGNPFTVTNGSSHGDNAGVANSSGTGSFVDVVGNPHSAVSKSPTASASYLFYNPSAFALPVGLTFGNEGRNLLYNPGLLNFDMGFFKNFRINERQNIQFRAESFNTFNHTNFTGLDGSLTSSDFLRATGAHDPRIIQLALKWSF